MHFEKTNQSKESHEISELLEAEGIGEFAKGTAREQVGNLLAERARMLNDLSSGELQMQKVLEEIETWKGRVQEKDKMRDAVEEEKRKLEEVKRTLTAERDRLKRDVKAAERKISVGEKEAKALNLKVSEDEKTRVKELRELKEKHRSKQ